jgi:serine/threonine-protein kinase
MPWSPGNARSDAPSPDAVRAQLERILANSRFASSERLAGFLRFIVEKSLSGEADQIKEYVVAVDVYERDAYDPKAASTVRVEASRLRGKLRDYYAAEGVHDPIHISIPRGAYVPVFEPGPQLDRETVISVQADASTVDRPDVPVLPPARRRVAGVSGMAVLLAGAVGGWWWWSGRQQRPASAIRGVAVLPFVDLSTHTPAEKFAGGLSEEITTALARIPGLRVPARTTMLQYRDRAVNVAAVGRSLGVDAVLEGSVRREQDRFRVTVQLIDVASGFHLWAETFDRSGPDTLAHQRSISQSLARALSDRIASRTEWQPESRPSPETLVLYTEAMDALRKDPHSAVADGKMPASLQRAIDLFEQAVRRESGFARAWAGLGDAYNYAVEFAPAEAGRLRASAEQALARALEINATIAEAHATLASIRFYRDWKFGEAESAFRRAIELDPRKPTPQREYAELLRVRGCPEEALVVLRRAGGYDDITPILHIPEAFLLYDQRRYDEAIARAAEALQRKSEFRVAHWFIGLAREQQGRMAEAEEKYRQVLGMWPNDGRALPALGSLLARTGRRREAEAILDRLRAQEQKGKAVQYSLALVYAGLQNEAAALGALERGLESRDVSMPFVHLERRFADLRKHPRFLNVVSKLGLATELT